MLRLPSLVFAALFAVAFFAARADAQPVHHREVDLVVDSVLAADTNEGMDRRLRPMSTDLNQLFHYSTYRLVSRQHRDTACGRMIAFTLPGGRILRIQPRAVDGDMIAMEIVLFEGARPVMTTDLKLRNHGTLFVGGRRYQQGMLIISIAAVSPGAPMGPPIPRGTPASAVSPVVSTAH